MGAPDRSESPVVSIRCRVGLEDELVAAQFGLERSKSHLRSLRLRGSFLPSLLGGVGLVGITTGAGADAWALLAVAGAWLLLLPRLNRWRVVRALRRRGSELGKDVETEQRLEAMTSGLDWETDGERGHISWEKLGQPSFVDGRLLIPHGPSGVIVVPSQTIIEGDLKAFQAEVASRADRERRRGE